MGNQRDKQEYWYFRTQEKWIFDADVQQIKNVPALGYIIFVIYIELCARSIKNKGYFRIDKTSSQNGYAADLARLINEDATNTGHALSYLINKGFVEVYEDENAVFLHLPVVDNNTGKSSAEADRIRSYQRQKKLDEERRLLIEQREANVDGLECLGCFKNVYLSKDEIDILHKHIKDVDHIIDDVSIKNRIFGIPKCKDYVQVLKYAEEVKQISKEDLNKLLLLEV